MVLVKYVGGRKTVLTLGSFAWKKGDVLDIKNEILINKIKSIKDLKILEEKKNVDEDKDFAIFRRTEKSTRENKSKRRRIKKDENP
jgi:hypothetical protein